VTSLAMTVVVAVLVILGQAWPRILAGRAGSRFAAAKIPIGGRG